MTKVQFCCSVSFFTQFFVECSPILSRITTLIQESFFQFCLLFCRDIFYIPLPKQRCLKPPTLSSSESKDASITNLLFWVLITHHLGLIFFLHIQVCTFVNCTGWTDETGVTEHYGFSNREYNSSCLISDFLSIIESQCSRDTEQGEKWRKDESLF